MLNALRNSVGSLGAKILLGLLVLAFAAWGLEGVFAARTQTVAAQVGEAEISTQDFSRQFDSRLAALRQQTGSSITPEDARRSGFDRVVLNQMATQAALDEEARLLGLDASDEAVVKAIREFPQFNDAYGKFDRTAYEQSLVRNRVRQNQFEESIRKDLARDALLQSIGNGTTAPRVLAETLYTYRNEKRALEHISLSPSDVDEPAEPTDAELATFHEENAERFTAPEYRKISYVALTVKDVAATIEKTDEELREAYDDRLADYTTPERRSLELMVFDTEEDAKEAVKKIEGGESFAKLAEARGLSAEDVSLGVQAKDEIPGGLADAAFAPTETGITDPVATARGWSLLNIRSITPENVVSFEDAKDALRTELTTIEARQVIPEQSIALDDQLAGGSSLQEAAEQSGGRYGEIDAVDATGRDPNGERVDDLPTEAIFLSSVFEGEVGEDPSLIEGETGDFYAIRVLEVIESALRPLDTVKDDVSGAWEVAQREEALEALTVELKGRLENGETLEEIAEGLDAEVEMAGPGTRTDRSLGLSADLLTALFSAEEGDAVEGQAADGLSRGVGTVAEIVKATSEDDVAAIDRSTEAYAARLSQDFVDQFSRTARDRHPLQMNQQAIDAVFTGGHGGGYGGGYGGGHGGGMGY